MFFYRMKQWLQIVLSLAIVLLVFWGLYLSLQKVEKLEMLAPLHDEQSVISDKELLSLLLNAYYMGYSMEELENYMSECTGDDTIAGELKQAFIKAGGGENYIRELCRVLVNVPE